MNVSTSIISPLQALARQADTPRSLWIDLRQPGHLAKPDDQHCTVLFAGKVRRDVVTLLHDAVRDIAGVHDTVVARVGGIARFRGNAEEGDPIVLLLQSPKIRLMKDLVAGVAALRGWSRGDDFDYTPHVTLTRVPRSDTHTLTNGAMELPPVEFTHLCVCCGEVVVPFKLGLGRKTS